HLTDLPQGKRLEADDALASTFERLLEYRERVTRALEPFRAEQHRSTDAQVTLHPAPGDRALLAGRLELLADLFIVSRVVLGEDAAGEPTVEVSQAPGRRCQRCWKWYEEMASDALCRRCDRAVAAARAGGA